MDFSIDLLRLDLILIIPYIAFIKLYFMQKKYIKKIEQITQIQVKQIEYLESIFNRKDRITNLRIDQIEHRMQILSKNNK